MKIFCGILVWLLSPIFVAGFFLALVCLSFTSGFMIGIQLVARTNEPSERTKPTLVN